METREVCRWQRYYIIKKHQIGKSIQQAGRYYQEHNSAHLGQRKSDIDARKRIKEQRPLHRYRCKHIKWLQKRPEFKSQCGDVPQQQSLEAQAKNIGVSLYIFPNGANALGRVAGRGDLGDPNSDFRYPCMAPDEDGKMVDQARTQCDIDPRYYYFNSKDYDSILKDLIENIATGGESPIQVMGKIASDLNKLPKKDKAQPFDCDCTRPDEYTSTPAFVNAIEPRGTYTSSM